MNRQNFYTEGLSGFKDKTIFNNKNIYSFCPMQVPMRTFCLLLRVRNRSSSSLHPGYSTMLIMATFLFLFDIFNK